MGDSGAATRRECGREVDADQYAVPCVVSDEQEGQHPSMQEDKISDEEVRLEVEEAMEGVPSN